MNRLLSQSMLRLVATAGAVAAACLSLGGCTLDNSATEPSSYMLPAISGVAMGGETPIKGAAVTLWQTDSANTGYGSSKATKLGTATSQTNGIFSFTTGYTCASGQFVYLTATGGDVTNGSATPMINNNVVLVAALGSCSNFGTATAQGKVTADLNEVSTVAAAYALNGFFTENASTLGSQKVYIGAPANNNATTGSCSGTGTTFSCTAAGLSHAFANAISLTDSVHYDGTQPTGLANATLPSNANGSVPQALIHALADILQYCVNSAGGVAGDSSACGTLFTNSTSPGGAVPTDTFAAMVNIAQAPYANVGTSTSTACSSTPPTTATGLFSLIPGTPAFVPVLACPPHDWSVAIAYTATSTGNNFGSPQFVALDANDNVYVETGNAYTPTADGLVGMTSTGLSLLNVASNTNYCLSGEITPDALGNVWMSVNATSTAKCSWAIYEFSSSGALTAEFAPGSGTVCSYSATTTPVLSSTSCPGFPTGGYDTVHPTQSTTNAIAFDHFNNMWYGRNSGSCAMCVFELPYSSTTGYSAATTIENAIVGANQMVIDSMQDVWVDGQSTTTTIDGTVNVIQNTGTAAAPTYTATTGFSSAKLATSTGSGVGYDNGGFGFDGSGNLWTASGGATTPTVYEFTPTGSLSTLALPSTPTFTGATTATHPEPSEVDGAGNYWYPSLSTSGSIFLQATPSSANYSSTATSNNHVLRPCYVPAGASTCDATLAVTSNGTTTSYYITGDPKALQIDSTGAIWVSAGSSSTVTQGYLVEILGAAAPTWPLYQLGVFGTKPQ